MKNRHAACILLVLTVLVWFLLISMANSASAHSWYPHECCSGEDCAPIPNVTVAYGFSNTGEEGYLIHLKPGDHPMVKTEQRYFVRMSSAQPVPETAPVEDQRKFHACVGKATQMILCFWKANSGV